MNTLTAEGLGKCYRVARKRDLSGHGVARLKGLLRQVGVNFADARFGRDLWALRHVSFAVEPGTILGIIGPNGSGKSTLLKVIARVTPPTEGRVTGRGRVVSLLEIGAGFHPDLSGRDNIFLNAVMYGIPRSEIIRKFNDIVEFAEVGEFIDMPVRTYSSGMYLRLAFSVAVNTDPDILLADEVLAVGDLEFQERCLERVEEGAKAGLTVLFVSHDMAAVTRLCDQVIWLSAGTVVKNGAPDDVLADYQSSVWTSSTQKRQKGSGSNPHGEILAVRLLSDSGTELGAVRVSEDVFVTVALRILVPDVSVLVAVSVSTRGIKVFRSVQPQPSVVPEAGVYRASVRIPARLLAETIYTVSIDVTVIKDGQSYPLIERDPVSFHVYDTEGSLWGRYNKRGRLSPGVVMPRLEWEVVRESDVVSV